MTPLIILHSNFVCGGIIKPLKMALKSKFLDLSTQSCGIENTEFVTNNTDTEFIWYGQLQG